MVQVLPATVIGPRFSPDQDVQVDNQFVNNADVVEPMARGSLLEKDRAWLEDLLGTYKTKEYGISILMKELRDVYGPFQLSLIIQMSLFSLLFSLLISSFSFVVDLQDIRFQRQDDSEEGGVE